uniref:Uncharacterized protein n=1 Tax=Poecilia reticulata TaxID=8081 RepID=A0A3P9NC75_POERE
ITEAFGHQFGKNTLLVDWMPQKDLLGHLKEAIYHGVPVVGLPVFYDQYDNLLRLQDRGAAKILTLATVDKEDTFLKTVKEVLLSRLHRDQPMKPIDTALFWIEFVIRHQGAAHLRTESHRLPWYSYYSVDVFLFFLFVVAVITFLVVMTFRLLCLAKCLKEKTNQTKKK